MILTITPNPAVDMTYHADSLTLGESHRVPAAHSRAGGKGLNVARVCHQLGHSVLALATVGGDSGAEFSHELTTSGVPHELIRVASSMRRSIALVEVGSGRTTVVNEIGSPMDESEWATLTESVRALASGARCLVGAGSLPGANSGSNATRDSFYAGCVEAAHVLGIPAIIDATGTALLLAASAGADLLKPNRVELAEATGLEDPLAGAERLLDLGARMVLVSLGEDGMFGVSSDDREPLFARLAMPLVGNPTGAGDAAVAAAAVCLSTGNRERETILRMATAWSAAAVLAPVAGSVGGDIAALEAEVIFSR
ncbi:hexose kinase [Salinibacterium sp. G-O1]|uniref:1-phosphofructokinase family hexose kinase n=1 Tax=Salinibacterium sp. G-O1 TaxID=3046208 RepID=UPI0024BA6317|nr:hexose kinase [Salinibacterium sp. G-O1]MDJ0334554.1 hexose kinase [Salinibacterium sp. G-O1]